MKHFRLFRCDRPEDKDKPYVPNATVLNELIASQPASGPKGGALSLRASESQHHDVVPHELARQLCGGYGPGQRRGHDEDDLAHEPDLRLPERRLAPNADAAVAGPAARPPQRAGLAESDRVPLRSLRSREDSPQKKPWACQHTGSAAWEPLGRTSSPKSSSSSATRPRIMVFFPLAGLRQTQGISRRRQGVRPLHAIPGRDHAGQSDWKSQDLDRKIKFNLGGWYGARVDKNGRPASYGENSIAVNNLATMLGKANYIGPKWETRRDGNDLRRSRPAGMPVGLLSQLDQRSTDRGPQCPRSHRQDSPPYDIVAYEGGPSGYMTGRPPALEKVRQVVGVGRWGMDCWMASYGLGWTYQNYTGYDSTGDKWSSHMPFSRDFRPNCGWLALKLRNCYASGDLMDVQETAMPTINYDKKTYPLIGCYALRERNRWSIFVLSASWAASTTTRISATVPRRLRSPCRSGSAARSRFTRLPEIPGTTISTP